MNTATTEARRARHRLAPYLAGLWMAAGACEAGDALEVGGRAGVEGRWFPRAGLLPAQAHWDGSAFAEPRFEWSNDAIDLTLQPFLRVDSQDPERTHWDLREANVRFEGFGWDWQIGLGKVFWGAAESNHLIDIVNQTDWVEDIDGEAKLGQPMIRATRWFDAGTLDLLVLPGFRERRLAGPNGRLYLPVDVDNPAYPSGGGRNHIDLAARWSQTLGNWDLGLGWFYGTRRDPRLEPNPAIGLATPHYDLIHQFSLDLQGAAGNWLWKFEGFYRVTPRDNYAALVGGFEYSFSDLGGSGAGLGVLAEYNYDGREQTLETSFQNDLFLGLRLDANDAQSSQVLAGLVVDLDHDGLMWRVEAARRLSENWTVEMTLQGFPRTSPGEPQHFYRDDGYARLQLIHHF